MKTEKWIRHFEKNRSGWTEPDWKAACELPRSLREPLAKSIAIFQLGESGDGTTIRRYAKKLEGITGMDNYDAALCLFITEEQRHAGLLAKVVGYLDGERLETQWSNSCFSKLRHFINLEFSIQILVTAEIIGMTYYAALGRHCGDQTVVALCNKLVRDEVKHITFHVEFLSERFSDSGRAGRMLWAAQFRAIFEGTLHAMWLDHGGCLKNFGTRRGDFFRSARRSREWFLRNVLAHQETSPYAELDALALKRLAP